MDLIRDSLEEDAQIGTTTVLAPKVLLRVGYQGRWSAHIRAIVDTGSSVTLVSLGLAEDLGCDIKRIQETASVGMEGLHVGSFEAYRFQLDLSFLQTPAQEPDLGLHLHGAIVFLSDAVEAQNVIVGQHDALERLRFEQRNYGPFYDFLLQRP